MTERLADVITEKDQSREPRIQNSMRCTMTDTKKDDSYIESETEREKGHEDTRHKNFECEKPDANLGCDPGIDVAG